MTTIVWAMASPNLLKRTYDATELQYLGNSPQDSAGCTEEHSMLSEPIASKERSPSQLVPEAEHNQPNSPVPSSTGSAAGDRLIQTTMSTTPTKSASKRPKLTCAEQETKRLDREIKDRQKADDKAKKEVERRARDIEREEKRTLKEAQLKLREDERKKKEEEKNKKEKCQLRLNSFFAQPSATSTGLATPQRPDGQSPRGSRRGSVCSLHDGSNPRSRSASVTPQKSGSSDYERSFPPFFLQSHTALAMQSHFSLDEDGLEHSRIKIDESFEQINAETDEPIKAFNPVELLHLSPHKQNRQRRQSTVREIVARIHGTSRYPIDLTESRPNSIESPKDLLANVSVRYLKFAEDVRPPYIGTYTKLLDPRACSRLCRNPFSRSLPTNYDYDSEAEWEEPGEGEDLDSEGEEEVREDDEGDEMEGFLDDDDEIGNGNRMTISKGQPILGDLEPCSTGLCWEDTQLLNHSGNQKDRETDLSSYRIEIISDTRRLPIDPYSTGYWQFKGSKLLGICPGDLVHASMDPPRLPLNTINRSNNLIPSPSSLEVPRGLAPGTEKPASAKPSKTPKRLIASDTINAFKQAVTGSDLTKAGLIEVLKKQFPKQSKDAIKDTLGLIAERVGQKEADKRWIIKAANSIDFS